MVARSNMCSKEDQLINYNNNGEYRVKKRSKLNKGMTMNKQQQKGGKGGKKVQKEKKEEPNSITTAILICDSFDHRFTPITTCTPRALIPLVNIPIIDYSLQFLVSAKITKLYLFCCAHAEKILEYIKTSDWPTYFDIVYISSQTNLSVGDALRDIYEQYSDDITSDFILLSSDVVSNVKMEKILEKHRENKSKDKNLIMTSLFKKASPIHRSRAGEDETIIAIAPTGQLLHYDNDSYSPKVSLDLSTFTEQPSVQFRYDLLDCRIDICSPQVLWIFQDNFDYQDLRKDFIKGVLDSGDLESETLGKRIYVQVIEDEYAARVRSLNTYSALSRDIVNRWTYPLVPEMNFTSNSSYSLYPSFTYKERSVLLALSSHIGRETVIGEKTVVGEHTKISQSIIGRNCKIGNKVTIKNSFIWDNVTIEDQSTIENSIICSDCVIKRDCVVKPGCLLSFNVIIGPNISLQSETKITRDFMESFDDSPSPVRKINLGEEGAGFLWVYNEGDPTNSLNYDYMTYKEKLAEGNENGEGDEEEDIILTQDAQFKRDIYEIIYNGIKDNIDINNLILEIKRTKLAANRTWVDCASALFPAIVSVVMEKIPNKAAFAKTLTSELKPWKKTIKEYLEGDGEIELIFSIQELCEEKSELTSHFQSILHTLYEEQVITEEAILEWKHELVQEGSSNLFLTQCEPFLKWLEEAEEDEEDEGEEGEEEDDVDWGSDDD